MDDLISRKRLLRDIYFQEGRYPETPLMRMAIREQPRVDAVVLPCKIGDTVWEIRSFHGKKAPPEGHCQRNVVPKKYGASDRSKVCGQRAMGKDCFRHQRGS